MPDYEKLYHLLFNAITDALEKLEQNQPQTAAELLRQAQQKSEEIYIEAEK